MRSLNVFSLAGSQYFSKNFSKSFSLSDLAGINAVMSLSLLLELDDFKVFGTLASLVDAASCLILKKNSVPPEVMSLPFLKILLLLQLL